MKKIDSQVKESVKEGAEILTGGEQIKKEGRVISIRPTVLKNVNPKMQIAQEEVFGPVAPIIVGGDEEEAIKLANDSEYGLGASIWTQEI